MAFCPNCGAQVAGAFCPNCGTAVTGGAPSGTAGTTGAGATGSAGAYVPPVAQSPSAPGLSHNVAAALCYLAGLVTGIIFLVLAPYNQDKTVRFHAFQSIFFNIGWIVFWIAWSFISIMLHGFGFLLSPLFGLLFLLLWLYLMFTAYQGKMVKLPVIGDLAEKQA